MALSFYFIASCFFAGCNKSNCDPKYRAFNFYLQISPDKKELRVGDTLIWKLFIPFISIDIRTNEVVDISTINFITRSFISVVRVDTLESPGIYEGGLKSFDISVQKGRNPVFSNEIGYKNTRLDFNLVKSDEQFEVLIRCIAKNKGVFMISHSPALNQNKCTLNDFVPVLKNSARNEELFFKYAIYNYPVTFYSSEYFFVVK